MNSQLDKLAEEIDIASEKGDVSELSSLIKKCENALEIENSKNRAYIYLLQANCYSSLANLKYVDPDYMWSWKQNDKILEILILRKAISEPEFSSLDQLIQCKILTNLGCSLSQFGRVIEAIKVWDSAISLIPSFAMALGNKGVGVVNYSKSLYDYSHAGILLAHAVKDLEDAVSEGAVWDSGLHPEAEDFFIQYHNITEKRLDEIEYDFEFDLDQWPLGESKKEIKYRSWCLKHNLFLTPLNDVCRESVSARDVLHLPSHIYNINEKPRFPNYYNILKQEYISARFMLFKSFDNENQHISDNDVLLLSGFDGVQFGYKRELIKTSYRLAYSLFDKIALFLNDYYDIGLKVSAVSFRRIWGHTKNKKFILNSFFEGNKNWHLRGLYYLSKDLFDENFIDVALPEAKKLAKLRNFSEHRFLSLQEYEASVENTDTHSYITFDDFQLKTLRIMSMAREALIYLSLAMHREEELRDIDNEKLFTSSQSIPIEKYK